MRRSEPVAGRRWSKKILVGSTTLGVIALGTGISLASTQSSTKAADSVTCIVQADAKAAADANSAISDVFGVGTKLHVSSAGRAVDVTVSAPLTAAAPPADNNGQQNNGQQNNGQQNNGQQNQNGKKDNEAKKNKKKNKKNKSRKNKATKNQKKQAKKTNTAKASTSSTAAASTAKAVTAKAVTAKAVTAKAVTAKAVTAKAVTAKAVTAKAVTAKAVTPKAAGVDPNTVCADLSKDAFNTLGNVANGNNVGAFIATLTPVADNGKQNDGTQNQGKQNNGQQNQAQQKK